MKNLIILIVSALLLNACANKSTFAQVHQISKNTVCSPCSTDSSFEARIKGLLYVSDIGIQCCPNKRTLDTNIALKKVYLHRFYDLKEDQKILLFNDKKLFVDVQFNAVFYTYLEQELKARGIVIVDNNQNNSPYISKIDLNFSAYSARKDSTGLHSKLVGVLKVSDINKDRNFTIRTKQDVEGFKNIKEITFYTHLLIKQMANKAASIISEL
ncbi:outer membrane lipoprotein MapA [Campylobacter sp. MIT 21-1685]|uniref:outer membrane lipoprotein MapA n=1 Tax=unclassified Campylobacter TaxID=2593542 RepID=UPI00224AAB0F|nr:MULTISPECIES: outer membrane lipoprotein MapA [unclassified Campylobacter]MCX2682304.1 outer membrane lipoprotein MapA [Campylobacter sp. MIT 21-1684]MCX2750584.1 outer membrane lipoprotein MapA [Campylobacter sp. MIT 21-1682]MCX2806869.1 outer membrane lipoprotein MapA [Campylobacter sp. MIT 21-1685]